MPILVYIQNMLNPGISPLYTCVLLSSLCLPRRGDYWEFLARGMTSVHSKHQTRCLSCCMLVCPNLVLKKCLSFEELISGVKILRERSVARCGTKHAALRQGMVPGMTRGVKGFKKPSHVAISQTRTDTATNQRTITRNWCVKTMHPKNRWFSTLPHGLQLEPLTPSSIIPPHTGTQHTFSVKA